MKELDLTEIDFDHVGKWKKEDILKSMAFRLGQGIGLHQGVELYTKADIAAYLPELRPYLYRQAETIQELQTVFDVYLQMLAQTETQTLPDKYVRLQSGAIYDIYKEKRIPRD